MALLERSSDLPLSGILEERARQDPVGTFLVFEDRILTYGQVDDDARSLAAALANLGVESGDRVAVILPGCPEFVVSLFALSRLGAVVVPMNPRLTEGELQYMLRHSQAVCAITVETFHGVDYLQLFEDLLPQLPELQYLVTVGEEDLWYDDRIFQFEDLVSAGRGRALEERSDEDPDELFTIVYTSGTTGKPKGVELTRRNLVHVAAATARGVGLEPEDRVIGVTALFHVFGLGPGILGTALAGATLVLQQEVSAPETLDLVEEHGVTVHYGVPMTFAAELREQRRSPRELGSLRVGLVAGAPIPDDLFTAVESEFCPVLLSAYSLSETASTVSMTVPSDPVEKRRFTVGRALEGTSLRVIEGEGDELPEESLGELCVKGTGLMRGYYRQPRETAASFDEEGYFRTGDLGIMDDGGYVHLVGRRRDVIIRAGNNVYPREVEDRLHAHPAVLEAAVVGIPDDLLGEAIVAVVVPMEGAIVTDDEVRHWCRQTLADHKVPDLVRFVEELPTTGTGKIRRVELSRLIEVVGDGPGS
jgi:fatty-acyl-CoA synthase